MTRSFIYTDKRYYKIYKILHVHLFNKLSFSKNPILNSVYARPRLRLETFFQYSVAAKTNENSDAINSARLLEKFVATSFFQRAHIKNLFLEATKYRKANVMRTALVACTMFKVFAIFYNLRHYFLRVILQKNLALNSFAVSVGNPYFTFYFKDMYALINTSEIDLYYFKLPMNFGFLIQLQSGLISAKLCESLQVLCASFFRLPVKPSKKKIRNDLSL